MNIDHIITKIVEYTHIVRTTNSPVDIFEGIRFLAYTYALLSELDTVFFMQKNRKVFQIKKNESVYQTDS